LADPMAATLTPSRRFADAHRPCPRRLA
jgi:hypothetical protein